MIKENQEIEKELDTNHKFTDLTSGAWGGESRMHRKEKHIKQGKWIRRNEEGEGGRSLFKGEAGKREKSTGEF